MRLPSILLLLVALAIGGGAAWWLLREGPKPVEVVTEPEEPSVPLSARVEASTFRRPDAVIAPIPFEGPWNPDERFPATGDDLMSVKLGMKPTLDDGMATGAALLEAWRGLKAVYIRWAGPGVREEFLKASVRLPIDAYLAPDQPGAPLTVYNSGIHEAGFEVLFRLPLIRIGPMR